MNVVTINSVRDGIILVLDTNFPGVPIMGEEIEQGMSSGMDLDPPCFFVKLLTASQTQELDIRYNRMHSFDIHYFAVGRKNRTMHDTAESLYSLLKLISIGGASYRGTNLNHEIVDEVLHFFVDYTFSVIEAVPVDPFMQTLEQGAGLK